MTIEAPGFDPELTGYSAVVLSQENNSVCHALISEYPQGEYERQTECGIELQEEGELDTGRIGLREEFIDTTSEMCPNCWPSSVV